MAKQQGRSFSTRVITRLLRSLSESGQMKKTNLASRAGLNYATCVKYIHFLARVGWAEITSNKNDGDGVDDIHAYVSVTPLGIENLRRLEADDMSNATAIASVNEKAAGCGDDDDDHDHDYLINLSPPATMSHNKSGNRTLSVAKNERHHDSAKSIGKENANVMIIDDDPNTLLTYRLFLTSRGYKAKAFSDPVKALRHFMTKPAFYDLLILDIRMPKVNGIQLYQTVRSLNPRLKVIFLSSLDATQELVSIFPEVKRFEVLRKPIHQEYFLNTVQLALKEREAAAAAVI